MRPRGDVLQPLLLRRQCCTDACMRSCAVIRCRERSLGRVPRWRCNQYLCAQLDKLRPADFCRGNPSTVQCAHPSLGRAEMSPRRRDTGRLGPSGAKPPGSVGVRCCTPSCSATAYRSTARMKCWLNLMIRGLLLERNRLRLRSRGARSSSPGRHP